MRKIVLLSCVSKKKDYETTAENLYDSSLFDYSLKYAKKTQPDAIYILSALYGLLEIKEIIKPYNKTLNEMGKKEKLEWSNMVIKQMREKGINFKNDKFIILAGNNYRKYLLEYLENVELPLEGMRIGEQLSYLKRSVQD